MKKVVVFILAFFYLGLTTGLAVNIHYCMGKIAGVEFNKLEDNECSTCKSKMACCGHFHQLVKVSDEHQQNAACSEIKVPEIQLNTFENLIDQLTATVQHKVRNTNISPPLLSLPDIYLQNCVFRI